MNSEETLWDIEEVAKYLKVSKDTIHRWIETKQLPTIHVGKKWLFRKEEIDIWLDSMKSTSNGEER